jgi:hypothetical protein
MMIDSNQPQFILPEQQTPQQHPNQPDEVIFSRASFVEILYIKEIFHKLIFSILQLREGVRKSKKELISLN